jgi:hypothetical protein
MASFLRVVAFAVDTTFTIMKRAREEEDVDDRPAKVQRFSKLDRLSRLSEELLVRILTFIPVPSLLVCQRYNTHPIFVRIC